jgi:hypothetical protein
MRCAKVSAKAFRAGFHRIAHRAWPVPVGSDQTGGPFRQFIESWMARPSSCERRSELPRITSMIAPSGSRASGSECRLAASASDDEDGECEQDDGGEQVAAGLDELKWPESTSGDVGLDGVDAEPLQAGRAWVAIL